MLLVPLIDWINAGSTTIAALATVLLAFAAGVSLWQERIRRKEEREEADAQIGAAAFTIGEDLVELAYQFISPSTPGIPSILRDARPEFDRIKERLRALNRIAPNASPEVAQAVRDATVAVHRMSRYCREIASLERDPEITTNVSLDELHKSYRRRHKEAISYLEKALECLRQAESVEMRDAGPHLAEVTSES